jgi:hypothetical protein
MLIRVIGVQVDRPGPRLHCKLRIKSKSRQNMLGWGLQKPVSRRCAFPGLQVSASVFHLFCYMFKIQVCPCLKGTKPHLWTFWNHCRVYSKYINMILQWCSHYMTIMCIIIASQHLRVHSNSILLPWCTNDNPIKSSQSLYLHYITNKSPCTIIKFQ